MAVFTPGDLSSLQEPSTVRIHPDGRRVAYVLTRFEGDDRVSAIHLLGPKGRQVVRCEGMRAHHPQWGPDGTRLVYVMGAADGVSWLHVIDGVGNEVEAPIAIEGDVTRIGWHPLGRRLVVEYLKNPPATGRGVRVIRRLRHHFDSRGFIGDQCWTVAVVDLEQRTVESVGEDSWHHFTPTWSPDGSCLALVTTRSPTWDIEWVWDVYIVNWETGEWQQVTDSSGVSLYPVFSPDGGRLAFLHNHCRQTASTRDYHLHEARLIHGQWRVQCLSHGLDRGAALVHEPPEPGEGQPTYTADGTAIAWVVNDRGRYQLVSTHGPGEHHMVQADQGWPTWSRDGHYRAQLHYRPDGPPRVTLTDWAGDVVIEADDNLWLQERTLCRAPTEYRFSSDDETVSAWIWEIPGRKSPVPLLIQFHGGPHGAFGPYFSPTQQLFASAGYLVAALNYRGSAGFGQAFAKVVHANWGPAEGRDAMALLDRLIDDKRVAGTAVGVFGPSYGGFMTNWMLTHYPDRIQSGVAISTVSHLITAALGIDHWESLATDQGGPPWEIPGYYQDHSPVMRADRVGAPLLLLHGEQDMTCPLIEAEMMFSALRMQGKPVELVRYVGESHAFHRTGRPSTMIDAHQRMLAWFEQSLGGA